MATSEPQKVIRVSPELEAKITELLEFNATTEDIVKLAGVSEATIYKIKKKVGLTNCHIFREDSYAKKEVVYTAFSQGVLPHEVKGIGLAPRTVNGYYHHIRTLNSMLDKAPLSLDELEAKVKNSYGKHSFSILKPWLFFLIDKGVYTIDEQGKLSLK